MRTELYFFETFDDQGGRLRLGEVNQTTDWRSLGRTRGKTYAHREPLSANHRLEWPKCRMGRCAILKEDVGLLGQGIFLADDGRRRPVDPGRTSRPDSPGDICGLHAVDERGRSTEPARTTSRSRTCAS